MNRKERRTIAKQILKLEKQCNKGINVSENMIEMENLIKYSSMEDLLKIDEEIAKMIDK